MTGWRYLVGWSEAELASWLAHARALPRNFDVDAPLTAERGWNIIHSRATVGQEPPGPPVPGGAFERLWSALQRFHHSDPRIVVAHFRDDLPFEDRRVLLELRALGLRFLCPTAIGGRRDDADAETSLRGFSMETIDGHIERGREWFLLEKEHATGRIHFRIEASWLPGQFPTWWSRLGFALVGRRYQRAWHRLAHLRLRRIAAGLVPDEIVGPDHVVHEGPPMPTEPVQFFAQRGVGRYRVDVEEEVEEMNADTLWRAVGLGALSGLRSFGPAAVLVRQRAARRRSLLGPRKRAGRALGLLAAGEVLADKLPFTPPRTQAASLLARMSAGAFVGGRVARGKGEARLLPALLGAAAAAGATYGIFHARRLAARRSKGLGLLVAVAEDALVFWGGQRLASFRP